MWPFCIDATNVSVALKIWAKPKYGKKTETEPLNLEKLSNIAFKIDFKRERYHKGVIGTQ